jgi:GNAT superfamily N-acetyltransferase
MPLGLATLANVDLEGYCTLPGLGALTPGQVHLHGPDGLLVLEEGGAIVARASLWWSHVPPLPDQRLGLIGHYAAAEAAAASRVLAAACEELAARGCTLALGPMDGNTWRRYRLLTQRGDEPLFFLEPDNPDDWPAHFAAAGFQEFARYYSSINDDNGRCRDRHALRSRLEARGYRLRDLDAADIDTELGRLWRLAGEGFAGNFLYLPIGEAEFRGLYGPLLEQIRPELVTIVEWQGTPVAFCLSVPNLLQARRGQAVDTLIVKSIAVAPAHRGKGLAGVMVSHLNGVGRGLGLHCTIYALMHEDNPSRHLDASLMRDFRRYALFGRWL